MKLSKSYPALLLLSAALILYSCDSVTDSSSTNDLLSQELTLEGDAKKDKVDVCHYDAELDEYKLINISGNAEQAHLDHGDGKPGESVPTMEENYVFDETCTPELDDRITACFKQAIEGVLGIIPVDELNLESFSGWEESEEPVFSYTNWYGIQTPLNGDYLKVWTVEEFDAVQCNITYPIDMGDYIQKNTGGGSSDSFEKERSYIEYLYNED